MISAQHNPDHPGSDSVFELRFRHLFKPGRAFAFPCDAGGNVDLTGMSERCRNSYFYDRTVVGSEVDVPRILRADRSARPESKLDEDRALKLSTRQLCGSPKSGSLPGGPGF